MSPDTLLLHCSYSFLVSFISCTINSCFSISLSRLTGHILCQYNYGRRRWRSLFQWYFWAAKPWDSYPKSKTGSGPKTGLKSALDVLFSYSWDLPSVSSRSSCNATDWTKIFSKVRFLFNSSSSWRSLTTNFIHFFLVSLMFTWMVDPFLALTLYLKSQYPRTNSLDWLRYFSLRNQLREFVNRSKHFSVDGQSINSHVISLVHVLILLEEDWCCGHSWDVKG